RPDAEFAPKIAAPPWAACRVEHGNPPQQLHRSVLGSRRSRVRECALKPFAETVGSSSLCKRAGLLLIEGAMHRYSNRGIKPRVFRGCRLGRLCGPQHDLGACEFFIGEKTA